MTETKHDQYRELVLQSSNLLLEGDLCRVLGRYEEAALKRLEAGDMRKQMAIIAEEAGKPVFALENRLSATACYLEATAVKEAIDLLARLAEMEEQGLIPADRCDLFGALTERRAELATLKDALERFDALFHEYTQQQGLGVPNDALRDFLHQWRRELPGFFYLHYALARQAEARGESAKAREHLRWAKEFCINDVHAIASIGYAFLMLGDFQTALTMGKAFLQGHASESETESVRLMMATSLHAQSPQYPDMREQALALLQPTTQSENLEARMSALALSAVLQGEQGHWTECSQLERELQTMEDAEAVPPESIPFLASVHDLIDDLRAHAQMNGTTVGRGRPAAADTTRILPLVESKGHTLFLQVFSAKERQLSDNLVSHSIEGCAVKDQVAA